MDVCRPEISWPLNKPTMRTEKKKKKCICSGSSSSTTTTDCHSDSGGFKLLFLLRLSQCKNGSDTFFSIRYIDCTLTQQHQPFLLPCADDDGRRDVILNATWSTQRKRSPICTQTRCTRPTQRHKNTRLNDSSVLAIPLPWTAGCCCRCFRRRLFWLLTKIPCHRHTAAVAAAVGG